ncbi:LLM class flavin-dependent oxidoreductase [Robbsia sp. KACC 23696]|uniref:LLM class flavin-dependent oxidoreductase n=1 Tax=Robbsia sp. KACC 23696 TaxID=3149231 RepID=UPI00325A8279
MSIEFIGYVSHQESSETHLPQGPTLNVPYIGAVAQAHEYGGFDRVLIAHSSASPDGAQIASYVLNRTKRLGVLLAHRPGFVAPTLAARQLATLDHFGDGRLAVHIISGGDDTEQQRDGDFLDHAARYRRTDEYLDVVKQSWTRETPFDHQGEFYQVKGHKSQIRPVPRADLPHLPVYFGGASDAAIEVAGKHADVYALWGESLAQVAELLGRVKAAAARYGRQDKIRFSLSLRPIVAATEEAAWARADAILEQAKQVVTRSPNFTRRPQDPQNAGSQRLLAAASQGTVVDKRLWTGMAALTKAAGNSTGLVGTPEQVSEALVEYYRLGITTFLIRGFDPLEDALTYGRDLLPVARARLAAEEARAARVGRAAA